jgi:hypothetical protein
LAANAASAVNATSSNLNNFQQIMFEQFYAAVLRLIWKTPKVSRRTALQRLTKKIITDFEREYGPLTAEDLTSISANVLRHPVRWPANLEKLKNKILLLEIALHYGNRALIK